uniref:Stringent starvation protein B n=1 Tax=Thermodesulfovibrio aggregans TaxID=86166 RepID=A0A7C4EJJ4_9BACT
MIEISEKLIVRLNEIKKRTFFELLELAGRVFIIVDYQENVIIGKRGFLPEEKERGLVLVFNKRMNFQWDEDVLKATLVFGSIPEKCYIPVNAIAGIFSPDLRVQLLTPVLKFGKTEKVTENLSRKDKIINISDLRKKK